MPLGSHSRSHPPKCQRLEASRIFKRLGIALSSSMAKQNLKQAIDFCIFAALLLLIPICAMSFTAFEQMTLFKPTDCSLTCNFTFSNPNSPSSTTSSSICSPNAANFPMHETCLII
ncbi:hypothetical protein S83_062445 [Arachis hypogaea]